MDIATATQLRDAAQTAYLDALAALSATDGDKSVRRHDIEKLRAEFEHWERVVTALSAPVASGALRPSVATARWTR